MQIVKASQATLTETQREQEVYHQCVVSSVGKICVEGVYSCVTWYAAEQVHSHFGLRDIATSTGALEECDLLLFF